MYLHRAGRCARAGRHGTSYVIASDADVNDRALFNLVRQQLDVNIVDATTFLRKYVFDLNLAVKVSEVIFSSAEFIKSIKNKTI